MTRLAVISSCIAVLAVPALACAQEWNRAGLPDGALTASKANAAPAPARDISGIWDAGGAGIAGPGHESAPWTDWAKQKAAASSGRQRAAASNADQRGLRWFGDRTWLGAGNRQDCRAIRDDPALEAGVQGLAGHGAEQEMSSTLPTDWR